MGMIGLYPLTLTHFIPLLLDSLMFHQRHFAVAANGALYSKEKTGIMPELVIKMYGERVGYKKRMLQYKQVLVDVEVEMKKRGLM